MRIRQVDKSDTDQFKEMVELIDGESAFMLYQKGERNMTTNQFESMITSFVSQPNSTILVVEENRKLLGYVMAVGGKVARKKHTASIVLGVVQHHIGRGVGTYLMQSIEKWANENGVTRLELTTMVHNELALALYKKMGFEVEGLRRQSFIIDGTGVDEYYLAKLLNSERGL
ncbi:N-acetyltransferase family protein [Salipaludibacillus sp. HK11]|uniref:GNAT family N-acetyltransferase n=1 Tax=Salipaludibacillus sp. HK11 TaxID=3394320 RepID=UPI0039FDDCDF